MDNVTHSLIGAVIGHGLTRTKAMERSGLKPQTVVLTSIIANNIPDLDIVIAPIMTLVTNLSGQVSGHLSGSLTTAVTSSIWAGQRAHSLIHHRGVTHTLILAPLMALAAFGFARLFLRRPSIKSPGKSLGQSPGESPTPAWRAGIAVAILGVLTHILADSWNEFGVRPFWPFHLRWYYGEMIFIVEPLIWLTLLPVAAMCSVRRWVQGIWAVFGALILALVWGSGLVDPRIAAALSAWALVSVWVTVRFRKAETLARAIVFGLVSVTLTLSFFGLSSYRAGRVLRETLPLIEPGTKLLSVSKGPAPSNPWCWKVTAAFESLPVGAKPAAYITRVGVLSLWPGVINPERCFARLTGVDPGATSGLKLRPESTPTYAAFYRAEVPAGELRQAMNSCWADALVRFSKVLYWIPETGEAGDLRYYAFSQKAGARFGFTSLWLRDEAEFPPQRCPVGAPQWQTQMSDWVHASLQSP